MLNFLLIFISLNIIESANLNHFNARNQYFRPTRSGYDDIDPPVYLLISTSSKIYCMKMPDSTGTGQNQHYYRPNPNYYDDLKNYEVIYEEKSHANNWITDAFYVKSENIIYVNVYNSTSATSDIFTLKFDPSRGAWTKKVLYRDQSYCLGITYNEDRKELYWTAAKAIVSGSSQVSTVQRQPNRVLFSLESAKKLLYLKYDQVTDSVYVSTLNYVYSCSLRQSERDECKIIARDLLSARGLYLDALNRHLYVVDHKKKNIRRIGLKSNERQLTTYHPDNSDDHDQYPQDAGYLPEDVNNQQSTILSSDIMPDIGDIFYMCLFKKAQKSILVWSEFSGKIKMTSLNDTSSYKVIFATNEYTYSINLMDNSTYSTQTAYLIPSIPSTQPPSTTQIPTTTPVPSTTPLLASTTVPKTSQLLTEPSTSIVSESSEVVKLATQPLLPWTRSRIQNTQSIGKILAKTSSVIPVVRLNQIKYSTTVVPKTTETITESTTKYEPMQSTDEDDDDNDSEEKTEPVIAEKISTTTIFKSTTPESTTTMQSTAVTTEKIEFMQKTSQPLEKDEENGEDSSTPTDDKDKQVQNFRAVNTGVLAASSTQTIPQLGSSSSSYNLLRSSPQLNVALYIVICLLCFSLVINIILLYVSKMKQSRDKLIITHEICDKTGTATPSQRSGLTTKTNNSQEGLGECNVNLINANGSATSGIDGEQ